MITPEEVIKLLNLKPHPEEGGYYYETYRSEEKILKDFLPKRYNDSRRFSTAIYYLLTQNTFSMMHKLKSDEIFHFYLGDPIEMLNLYPDGNSEIIILGQDIINGMKLQVTVQKEVWQGCRLIDGGNFALMGTTVSPGFEFIDYKKGNRNELIKIYPDYKDLIIKLTK